MPRPPTRIGILAGGSGTRFWPAGRRTKPKQLLALDGDDERPLLRATVERVAPLTQAAPWIIAPRPLKRALAALFPELGPDAYLWEPAPRNTCAAVALAAATALAESGDGPLLIVPADHHVAPLARYRQALRAMADRARRFDGIVTLGLQPTRPATGYGYLERGALTASSKAGAFHEVRRFIEKPPAARARRYVQGGLHSWNGGTFAFRPSIFLAELERLQPEMKALLDGAMARWGKRTYRAALDEAYASMASVSVDYAVMERAAAVEVLVSDIAWDDLGSWDAVARHRTPDADDNRLRGDVTAVESRGCLVDAGDGHVALLGVEDLVVVRTGDTVLVTRRGRGEDVRAIVDRLASEGREDLLT